MKYAWRNIITDYLIKWIYLNEQNSLCLGTISRCCFTVIFVKTCSCYCSVTIETIFNLKRTKYLYKVSLQKRIIIAPWDRSRFQCNNCPFFHLPVMIVVEAIHLFVMTNLADLVIYLVDGLLWSWWL